MRILVVGGTGPTGLPIVQGLVEHGHDVTILHRGLHEHPQTPPQVTHLHADPYDEDVARRRAGGHARGTSSSPCTGGCAASPR